MTSSGSLLVIRSTILLLAVSPGTIGTSPDLAGLKASSFRSKRNLAFRSLSSGPWHLKQFSERIGRISRLKSMEGVAAGLVAARPEKTTKVQSANTGNVISLFCIMSKPIRRTPASVIQVSGHPTHPPSLGNVFPKRPDLRRWLRCPLSYFDRFEPLSIQAAVRPDVTFQRPPAIYN